jgi:hypothetical protein
MEPRFAHDFSNVRVHADHRAAESARAVNARAYTVGQDVVFGAGQYSPHLSPGLQLMSHELAHVVEQKHRQTGRIIQRWPATGSPDSTPWDQLLPEAQRTVDKAFFNKLDPESQSAFYAVYSALAARSLWSEVENVFHVFPKNVRGIHATVKPDLFEKPGFSDKLRNNTSFCKESPLISRLTHPGQVMWREVVPAGSEGLHLGISRPTRMTAHLDTLAPVAGRGADGACMYSAGHLLPHVGRDLLGLRGFDLFPPPTGEPRPGDVQPAISFSIPGS